MNFPSIYLASRSPRRRELLLQMDVDFSVINPDIDESVLENELPIDYVSRIARLKAEAGRGLLLTADRKPVLAADTAVVIDKTILGKPQNDEQAASMLRMLSGKTHQVMTAIALTRADRLLTAVSVNNVCFTELSEQDIFWYIKTKEGVDKAGGYAVQGLAALFIEHIEGSYSGIMGLPIRETGQLLLTMDD
ncbi:Maf family protein [Methylophaga sp.]|uniref:Maf family protein n=1 Tax=Methylophaga sp. TaxID=2024840 RepID=UPI003A8DDB8D